MAQPTGTKPHALDEQLCFALYAASRAMTGTYRPLLGALGLTYPQYLVMLVLWERGDLTVTDIGAELQLETGTLSPLLQRLEVRGLISRTRQAVDERSVLIGLRPAGRALQEPAAATQERVVGATGMSGPEIAGLRELLQGLAGRLRTARA